jgi:hypothetical protein
MRLRHRDLEEKAKNHPGIYRGEGRVNADQRITNAALVRIERNAMAQPQSNEEIVLNLLRFSPYGALGQIFIMEAIREYANNVSAIDPATITGTAFINPEAWVGVAKDVKQRLEEFQKQPCKEI